MLPGPVLVMLRGFAILLPPHLVLAVSSSILFDDRGVFICCTLLIASVISALMLHMHDCMDARIAKGLAAQERALDATVHVVDVMAGETVPVPAPRGRTTRPLRAVPDDA